jgi:hypothetical protein
MNIISVTFDEIIEEFEIVKDWTDSICKDILNKDLSESKINSFYHYGYFLPKVENKEEFYSEQYDRYSKMLFDDRLKEELSKVRTNVTIKIGNFMMTNRLPKGTIPKVIKEIVTEVTKYKMIFECEIHNNEEVRKSIPDFDDSIVSFELIKNQVSSEPEQFDMDEILDKISESGMDSLTESEKNFLKNQSKNI